MKKICTAFFIVLPILFSSINKAFSNFYSQLNIDSMPTGNYANVNGIKMYYEIYGEGEPLVLIHGGGSTIQTTFEKILPTLAQHYKCIAVELQAHGRTSDRNAPESFTQDADDVAALLKQLNFNKASFFGFSNGASTTMQIAIRHPELVDKIIVVAGAYKREGFIPGFFDGFKHATLETMPRGLRDAFLKVNPDSAALLNMFNKDVARMVAFKDWSDEDLKSIKAPALIINADKDVILPEHALKMSQLIPNARLIILPGVHGECIGEIETASLNSKQPEMVVELVKEFLDK
jgi:pimeloyl-ACP methyl ester carboxylesterase